MERKASGFTLIEAVVTVSVLSILLATGLPAFSALLEHLRATSTLSLLVSQMGHARMAAVKYRRPVILCPSTDGLRCDRGGDWSNGWMIFVVRGDRGGPTTTTDLLQVELAPRSQHMSIRSGPGRPHLRYLPDGRSAGSNLSIEICSKSGLRQGAVVVNNAGRPRIERGSDGKACSS